MERICERHFSYCCFYCKQAKNALSDGQGVIKFCAVSEENMHYFSSIRSVK